MPVTEEYIILTMPDPIVRGQLFIAGPGSFKDATMKVSVADCHRQDVPARVLAEGVVELAERPATNWVTFGFPIKLPSRDEFVSLDNLSILAEITSPDGKLLFVTKVSHRIDISAETKFYFYATVVVEKVD